MTTIPLVDDAARLTALSAAHDKLLTRLAALEEAEANRAKGLRRHYGLFRVLGNLLVVLIPITVLLILFTPFGDWLGVRDDWFVIATDKAQAPLSVQRDAIRESTRNMLTVIVPMFLGITVWLVTVVAERRLKTYDETLDKFSKESRERDARYDTKMDQFRDEITDSEDRIQGRVSSSILATMKQDLDGLVEQSLEDVREKTIAATVKVTDYSKRLEERFGPVVNAVVYDQSGHSLTSVGETHNRVTALHEEGKNAEAALLTQEVLLAFVRGRKDPSVVRPSGQLNDWFNLSAQLGRKDQEGLALRVCLAGLEQQSGVPLPEEISRWPAGVPANVDLLAHAIKYASSVNDGCLEGLLKLSGYDPVRASGTAMWNWRSYLFTMEALEAMGRADEAIALGKTYLAQSADDVDQQKVLSNLGGIMWSTGRRREATALLVQWLDDNPNLPSAQVLMRLIEWKLGAVDAETIVGWVDRGIRDLAEEQASANHGSLFFFRALGYDRMAHDAVAAGRSDEAIGAARRALDDYRLAKDVGVIGGYLQQIATRYTILTALLKQLGDGDAVDEHDASPDWEPNVRQFLYRLSEAVSRGGGEEELHRVFVEAVTEGGDGLAAHLIGFLRAAGESDNVPAPLRQAMRVLLARITPDHGGQDSEA